MYALPAPCPRAEWPRLVAAAGVVLVVLQYQANLARLAPPAGKSAAEAAGA